MNATNPSKPNPFFSFTIGAGVGALVLFCLWMTVRSNNQQLEAQAEDRSPHAKWADAISQFSADPEEELSQQGRLVVDFQVTDEMVDDLTGVDGIETLILDEGVVTDEGLDVIAALPRLVHLRLRQSPISDAGFEKLSRCDSLEVLNLPQCQCTVKGIGHLAALSKLRQLRLGSDRLSDDASEAIAELSTLESLHLIGVKITDDGLKQLATLPELQSLYLDDSDVTDDGWDWLLGNRPGLHIHVNQNHLDRDPKKHQH